MKTKFEMLDISMNDLHEFLKNADYKGYTKARTWAYAKLEENGCNMTKEYFAVFWNRLMCKLAKEYGYKIPNSTEERADYQRAYRQKKRERDALRLRKIRANEAHKAMIRAIPVSTNTEHIEEIANRLEYLPVKPIVRKDYEF
jgi:hypothetical protein